jgi:hypothetical protein
LRFILFAHHFTSVAASAGRLRGFRDWAARSEAAGLNLSDLELPVPVPVSAQMVSASLEPPSAAARSRTGSSENRNRTGTPTCDRDYSWATYASQCGTPLIEGRSVRFPRNASALAGTAGARQRHHRANLFPLDAIPQCGQASNKKARRNQSRRVFTVYELLQSSVNGSLQIRHSTGRK